jgi:hypothetical protein
MMRSSTCFVFVGFVAVALGQGFKPFKAADLEKYKSANTAEKSDLKVHVAAAKVPKEDLAKIEELCIKRFYLFYSRIL